MSASFPLGFIALDTAAALWRSGHDTHAIARALGERESRVANAIDVIRRLASKPSHDSSRDGPEALPAGGPACPS